MFVLTHVAPHFPEEIQSGERECNSPTSDNPDATGWKRPLAERLSLEESSDLQVIAPGVTGDILL